MPPLLRIMLILFIGFAATFLLIKGVTGLSFADVENWLRNAREISAEYVVLLVIALLVADLFGLGSDINNHAAIRVSAWAVVGRCGSIVRVISGGLSGVFDQSANR